MSTTTNDLGLIIRDMIEHYDFTLFDWKSDEIKARKDEDGHEIVDSVAAVDASDASNLVVHCESGAVFTVRIFRTA